jgi:TP901 family phage tail tape measure protein
MANTEKVIVQVVVKGEGQLKSLDKQTKGNSKSFLKLAATIGAATAAFGLVNKAVSNAIKGFKDFEFQMARVKAISGANNEEFNKLKKTALELGRTTFFTANQVAELQTNFSKLGFTTREILLAQEATLGLATVTGVDLGRAAEVAGAAVRSFNLDASDTARVVDIMNLSFASSALDLEKFQTSMSKVGPIAAGMNIPLETTTAIMGTLTDAGIEASIAGTSLRNIFLQMGDPTSDLSKHLGFTVKNSHDLHKALAVLNETSPEVRRNLVNIRQVAALNVMAVGAEKVERLDNAFGDAIGTTEEMSDMMKDTLQGSIFELLSAVEGLSIALFEELVGTGLKEGTQGLTEMINKLTDNAAKVAEQIRIVGKFIGTLIKVTLAYKAFNLVVNTGSGIITGARAGINSMRKNLALLSQGTNVAKIGFRTLGVAIKGAFIATGVGVLVVAITELISSLSAVEDEAQRATRSFRLLDAAQERFNVTMERTNKLLGTQPKSLEEVDDLNKKITEQIDKTTNISLEDARAELLELQLEKADLVRTYEKLRDEGQEEGFIEGGTVVGGGGTDLIKDFKEVRERLFGDEGVNKEIKEFQQIIKDAQNSVVDLNDKIIENEASAGDIVLTTKQENQKSLIDAEKIRNAQSIQLLKERLIAEEDTTREHDLKMEAENIAHLRRMLQILTESGLDPVATAQAELKLTDALVKQQKRINKEKEKGIFIGQTRISVDKELNDLAKENLELEKEFLKEIKDDLAYDNALDKLAIDKEILAGTISQIDAEDELRKKQIENTKAAIDEIESREFMTMESHELLMELEQKLIDLKLKGIKDVKGARKEELDQLKGVGDQLITLAGEDEKYQGVREAGIKISAAATLANNAEALSEQFKGLSKDIGKGFPTNIIAIASTLGLLISMRQNFKALTSSSPMAKGGMIEEFGNGGMVHGKAHAFGGEKFAVGGRVVELEGGEAVINKRSTAMFKDQLSAMNSAGGGVKFADGGLLNSTTFTQSQFNALSRNQGGNVNKVVVVESDITDTQNVVNVIQSNATI